MGAAGKSTTTVSTKGQVILPKAVREKRNWRPGTRLLVEETPDGVLLKPAPYFKPTTMDEVAGCLYRPGQRASTIEEMDEAVGEAAVERYKRSFDDRD